MSEDYIDIMIEEPATNFGKVVEWMDNFGQEVKYSPAWPDEKTIALRTALIVEEVQELKDAIEARDIVEVADALTDILYVVYGAGAAYGIDLDSCFDEVHRSNWSKADENGNPIFNEVGKLQKGPNYSPPDLKPILFPLQTEE